IFVRPSSTVSCTGMSSISSMSLCAPATEAGANCSKTGGCATCTLFSPAPAAGVPCSAIAAAQSSALMLSAGSGFLLGVFPITCFDECERCTTSAHSCCFPVGARQHFLDAQRVLAVEHAAAAFHHRHAVYLGDHGLRNIHRDYVADLHGEQLVDGKARLAQVDR